MTGLDAGRAVDLEAGNCSLEGVILYKSQAGVEKRKTEIKVTAEHSRIAEEH